MNTKSENNEGRLKVNLGLFLKDLISLRLKNMFSIENTIKKKSIKLKVIVYAFSPKNFVKAKIKIGFPNRFFFVLFIYESLNISFVQLKWMKSMSKGFPIKNIIKLIDLKHSSNIPNFSF